MAEHRDGPCLTVWIHAPPCRCHPQNPTTGQLPISNRELTARLMRGPPLIGSTKEVAPFGISALPFWDSCPPAIGQTASSPDLDQPTTLSMADFIALCRNAPRDPVGIQSRSQIGPVRTRPPPIGSAHDCICLGDSCLLHDCAAVCERVVTPSSCNARSDTFIDGYEYRRYQG